MSRLTKEEGIVWLKARRMEALSNAARESAAYPRLLADWEAEIAQRLTTLIPELRDKDHDCRAGCRLGEFRAPQPPSFERDAYVRSIDSRLEILELLPAGPLPNTVIDYLFLSEAAQEAAG